MIKELNLDGRVIRLVAGGMMKEGIELEALNTTATTNQTDRTKLIIVGSSIAAGLALTGVGVYFACTHPEAISAAIETGWGKLKPILNSREFMISGALGLLKTIGCSITTLCLLGTIMYVADANA